MTLQTAWILLSQYADDTTIYLHGKPTNLKEDEKQSWQALDDLADLFGRLQSMPKSYEDQCKVMLFSTQQLSGVQLRSQLMVRNRKD